jgi:hypothetical protein
MCLRVTRVRWYTFVAFPAAAAATLGAIGYACGFYGPIFLNPEANLGPLLGIFFSGPLGLGFGLALGLGAAILRLRPVAFTLTLVGCSVMVSGATLYYSLPESRHRGFVIDAEVRGCATPELHVSAAIGRWETSDAAWRSPRPGWKQDVPRMLQTDRGVVLTLLVSRRDDIFEERKPWNRGRLTPKRSNATPALERYFARFAGPCCHDYAVGERRLFAPVWEASSVSPPDILPTLLGLHVLADVPTEFLGIVDKATVGVVRESPGRNAR